LNKHGLGRGLDALIPTEQEGIETIQEINIDEIVVNNKQPRKDFDEEKLEELAASMEQHGVLQPVILRKVGRGYELVAGERRWRAAAKAGIKKIPAVVKELSDGDVLEIALIENLQREDLNPIEEASAYKQLMDEFGLTQEELAKRVGKSRSQIANTLRLLNLEEEILKFIFEGKLTAGHARALLSIEDKKLRYGLAKKISNEGLSVRQAEQLAQNLLQKKEKKSSRQTTISPIMSDIAEKLQQSLGTKVRIRGSEKRGKIEIEFYSSEELERILEVIAEQ